MSGQTDRELLELAAKAAGFEVSVTQPSLGTALAVRADLAGWFNWNPLTDDGDALRLAVRLHLDIRIGSQSNAVTAGWGSCISCIQELVAGDPYAATRRAIVRAAAAIGERTFSTAAHVRQATPSPADPGVGGELLRIEE